MFEFYCYIRCKLHKLGINFDGNRCKNESMKTIQLIFLAIMIPFIGACNDKIDKTTVKTLDIERYMGKWYEIARFDHKFERGKVGVTANYSLNDDGTILVVNSGYNGSLNGELETATGKAKQPNPKHPGELKVSFFWTFYAQYSILELADDYSYALIGSSSDKYLWILSRTPQMSQDSLNMLLQSAGDRGYDTSKLIYVKQSKAD